MNVYNFDKTIYKGVCGIDFYLFCLKKNLLIISFLPAQLFSVLKFLLGFSDQASVKEKFYCFIKQLKNIDILVTEFWDKNKYKIQSWYRDNKKSDDIVISDAPEFLLMPICSELGVKAVIASKVDKNSGKTIGRSCFGDEKANRLMLQVGKDKINNFYSNSLNDAKIANLAKASFVVSKCKLVLWNEYKPPISTKIKSMVFSSEFFIFLLIGCINSLNGVLFSYIFSLKLNPNLAFVVGYVLSLTISYLLNSLIAFKQSLGLKKYIKFCISYIPNFIIQNLFVLIFLNWLGIGKLTTYILAAIVGIPVTFLMLKLFAFAQKSKT